MSDFFNSIFPEKNICFICQEYGSDIGHNLCSICREKLIFINHNSCSICGRKLEESQEEQPHIAQCRECIRQPHSFTKSIAPLSYQGPIKQFLYDFKYNNRPHMYKMFGQLMLESIIENDLEHVDLIVPVPLHKDREKKRGYNQSELLAKYISKQLRLKLDSKHLIRSKHSTEQNKLNRRERLKNLEGVFTLTEKDIFVQKKILLVDDIYTTGSTVDNCSKLLIDSGASEIFVVASAVTPNNIDDRERDIWK